MPKNKRSYKIILYLCLSILILVSGVKWYKKKEAKDKKETIKIKQINQINDNHLSIPLYLLKSKYELLIVDDNETDYDVIINNVFGDININDLDTKNAIKIFYTSEAYLPNLDEYDLVLGFDHVDDPRYIRYPYYYVEWGWGDELKVASYPRFGQGKCNPKKEIFACFLVSNGCSDFMGYSGKIIEGVEARDSLFYNLSKYKWIASGGKHLNNIGSIVPKGKKPTQDWLGKCKFVISYENQYHNGYITEKVFQSYFAGAIPIYWGDETTLLDINKNAIIYVDDFKTEQDLIEYIKKVDNDDELYCKIWNKHLVTNPNIDHSAVQEKVRKKLFQLINDKRRC